MDADSSVAKACLLHIFISEAIYVGWCVALIKGHENGWMARDPRLVLALSCTLCWRGLSTLETSSNHKCRRPTFPNDWSSVQLCMRWSTYECSCKSKSIQGFKFVGPTCVFHVESYNHMMTPVRTEICDWKSHQGSIPGVPDPSKRSAATWKACSSPDHFSIQWFLLV